MQMMRSWMFVPGHQQKMIDKALGLKLDVAMFDLEDGAPRKIPPAPCQQKPWDIRREVRFVSCVSTPPGARIWRRICVR